VPYNSKPNAGGRQEHTLKKESVAANIKFSLFPVQAQTTTDYQEIFDSRFKMLFTRKLPINFFVIII
jgi:hypothetical protein